MMLKFLKDLFKEPEKEEEVTLKREILKGVFEVKTNNKTDYEIDEELNIPILSSSDGWGVDLKYYYYNKPTNTIFTKCSFYSCTSVELNVELDEYLLSRIHKIPKILPTDLIEKMEKGVLECDEKLSENCLRNNKVEVKRYIKKYALKGARVVKYKLKYSSEFNNLGDQSDNETIFLPYYVSYKIERKENEHHIWFETEYDKKMIKMIKLHKVEVNR